MLDSYMEQKNWVAAFLLTKIVKGYSGIIKNKLCLISTKREAKSSNQMMSTKVQKMVKRAR